MTSLIDQNQNSSRYFVLSIALHIVAVVVANLLALAMVVEKKETIQIEVLSTPPPPPIVRAQEPIEKPEIPAPPVAANPPPRSLKAAASTAKPSAKLLQNAAAPAKPAVAEPDFSDTMPESPVVVAPQFDSHVVDDDLNQVSKEENQKFKNTADQSHEQLSAEATDLEKNIDQSTDDLKQDVEQKNAQMAAKEEARLAKDKAELAKRQASEAVAQIAADRAAQVAAEKAAQKAAQAAAEKARRDELAREGRERAAAQAASQAAEAKALRDRQAATTAAAASAAGSGQDPNAVRQVTELRQMPGNKKPQYEEQERFDRLEGTVIFQALVTKDGHLTNFHLVQSSGYRSLDLKAFQSMRTWRFYPGQQGPVEMPFVWNIKGGPQERAVGLRKKVAASESRH